MTILEWPLYRALAVWGLKLWQIACWLWTIVGVGAVVFVFRWRNTKYL